MKQVFGFLVHPRTEEDFLRKFPYLRILPKWLIDALMFRLGPVLVSEITGLKNREGKEVKGYIIAITMSARQMTEHRDRAREKILEAVGFARKKGVAIIGLGALTASLSRGGLDITERFSDIGVTTGRAYTVKTVSEYALDALQRFGLSEESVQVAIVGAGGSIGAGCASYLARKGVRNFLLIDLEKRAEKLALELKKLHERHEEASVRISHRIGDIREADIVIAATNAPEALIKSDDLKPGAIVINDAQPSDIDASVLDREDVLVIEGGVIRTPGIRCNFNLGLAGREDTFCCLGEVLLLAYDDRFGHFALGELDASLIEEIRKDEDALGFSLSPYQNDRGYIPEEKIATVKHIIAARRDSRVHESLYIWTQ